ncbi:MAG: hypothetical protein NTW75_04860 [Planctomycetales bacterium]|jgi:preprotein translocase subunit SecG|nr:hypothetical protein [Planctomycetales bacterium]
MAAFLFRSTAMLTTSFVVTILAMVAMTLGDPSAPVNRWFDTQGSTVMIFEVVGIVILGLAAMAADRCETVRLNASRTLTQQEKPLNGPSTDEA